MYDVIIIDRGTTYFTAEKFTVSPSGRITVFHRELGDVSFFLEEGQHLIIKPFNMTLLSEDGKHFY